MEQQSKIFENLYEGASEFVNYLTMTHPGEYEDIYERFKKYVLANNSTDFMEIYNNYDPTSFVQYDSVLMVFAKFCNENIDKRVVRDYKIKTIVDIAKNDFDFDVLFSFKSIDHQEIMNLICSSERLLSIIDAAEIFSFHMGYNHGYSARFMIEELEIVLLANEEKSRFADYKTTTRKEREMRERKASEDYYREKHQRRRHRI